MKHVRSGQRTDDLTPLVGIGKPNYKAAKVMAETLDAQAKPGAPTPKAEPVTFRAPKGKPWLMRLLGPVSRWILKTYFKLKSLDLPEADRARLLEATGKDKAFFFAPVHPEFTTDWLIDKQVVDAVAPDTVHWADDSLVRMAPGFLGANNVMSNQGGRAAKDFSIRRALMGKGVLLHPAGAVRWTGDDAGHLFDGIAEMAVDAAALSGRNGRPVSIVPLVWKLRYTTDITQALHGEMALIEKALKLRDDSGVPVPERFKRLQEGVFNRQRHRFGVPKEILSGSNDFFEKQLVVRRFLVGRLRQRYAVEDSEDVDRTITRMQKEMRAQLRQALKKADGAAAERLKFDLAMADEAMRLGKFSREVYGGKRLSQEQLAESLKRLRADLMAVGGLLKLIPNKIMPRPLGPRQVHVRVPSPVSVPKEGAESAAAYTQKLRETMQKALDEINAEIAPEVERFSHRNPFVR